MNLQRTAPSRTPPSRRTQKCRGDHPSNEPSICQRFHLRAHAKKFPQHRDLNTARQFLFKQTTYDIQEPITDATCALCASGIAKPTSYMCV
eukprot:5742496-Amphidinium_carterae.1